jgi:hypothetical protein
LDSTKAWQHLKTLNNFLVTGDSMAKARKASKKVSKQKSVKSFKFRYAPLKGSFMVLAIIGFFITAYLIYPISYNFGVALMLAFVAMFIASLISMTKAPVVEV